MLVFLLAACWSAFSILEVKTWPTPATFVGTCGKQEINPVFQEGRIINGGKAETHSWPWQASLYGEFVIGEKIYLYQCGGAILNNDWVITAAHCFYYPDSVTLLRWMIHVGESIKDHVTETVQVRKVQKYITHEDFIFPHFKNDIALVKLERPLEFNTYVHPICIPPAGRDVPENTMCVVAGFAHNQQAVIPLYAPFHQLITPIISRKSCSTEEFYGGKITQHMICSGYVGGFSDTCTGDSGRPLMCMVDDKWYAKGILSYGHNQCGRPKKPGVYTKTSSFVPWIEQKITQEQMRKHGGPSTADNSANVK